MARSSSFALQINTMKQGLRGSHAQVMAGRPEAFAEARAINRRALGHEPAFEARPAFETDNGRSALAAETVLRAPKASLRQDRKSVV